MAFRWTIPLLVMALALSSAAPVWAHTTLGDLTATPPYRANDSELDTPGGHHVPGPLGYVWPGAGLDMYSGTASNPPGYQSPFANQEPLQAAGDSYSPEGAILTSTSDHDSVGDFIIGLNFSDWNAWNAFPSVNLFNYSSLTIYIPAPVFDATGKLISDGFEPTPGIDWDQGQSINIVTTITNDYGDIFVTRADINDPFAPGWWIINIEAPPQGIVFNRNFDNWYYVRINNMKAPFVAGTYFFKIFLGNSYPVHSGTSPTSTAPPVPMENWPMLLVKGEVDPAIISGTLRYGDLNSTLYGQPINLPGFVTAIGIANDPLTNQPTGRPVEARGYFNATAGGHYEVEGVAPGTYDLYASAAGLPEQRIARGVQVLRGQSLRFNGYMKVGFQLRGTVFSKLNFGEKTWPAQRPISVIIYNSKSYDVPSIETESPINLTDSPYTSYVNGNTFFSSTGFSGLIPGDTPKKVAFPWDGPLSYYTYTNPNIKDPFGLFNGVGPAQVWWVDPRGNTDPNTGLGSSNSEFTFQFGSEGNYGVPTKLSGMVPQIFATWTSSLSPGTYYIRIFLNGYVQTTLDGTTFVDYPFVVPQVGPYNTLIPIDLIQSCGINVTVHFHDYPNTLEEAKIGGPDPSRYLIAEAFAEDNSLAAFNFTKVTSTATEDSIELNGLGMAGDPLHVPPLDPRAPIKYSLARYRGAYDYGLLTDTYTVRIFMRGYIQALPPATSLDEMDQPVSVTLSVGTCLLAASTHMYRGGSINASITSTDWESPEVERNWVWNGTAVNALVYDISDQNFIDVINFWNAKLQQWQIPTQNSRFVNLPWAGWLTSYGPGSSYLVTNGSITVDRDGPDLPNIPSIDPANTRITLTPLQENILQGFLFNYTLYRRPTFRSNIAIYPGTYALNGWTYGYVQANVVTLGDLGNVIVAVPWLGQSADINLKLIIGVNITLTILFKTENTIEGTPYNMTGRIEVFDDQDRLVAATTPLVSDIGVALASSDVGFFANGKKILGPMLGAGTTLLTYKDLAGLFEYVDPTSPRAAQLRRVSVFSPDHGIWGSGSFAGSYAGSWRVMVDSVNWYRPTTAYPPVPALLQGQLPYFLPFNHLGPYAQNGLTLVLNAPLSGEASAEFEVDRRGYIQGIVLGMNWDDATRTMSWVTVKSVDSTGYQYYWYTWDGWFDGYLEPGTYQTTITEWKHNEGHQQLAFILNVNPGEQSTGLTYILPETQIPIPETFTATLTIIASFATALLFMRKRKRG
ncbi:MAG TPA: carboxypeptidase-like regulatory domain-containing protein [archaeon]|nr:carboxypeptidase-like regulatory domain-containing protein [archaeon]